MPALDKYHFAVKKALERDGWTITAENALLEFGGVKMFIDIRAEALLIAERDQRKIAVEVKSFLEHSTLSAFQDAVGQYLSYLVALESEEPDRILSLAAPQFIWEPFAKLSFTQAVMARVGLRVLVFDPVSEEVVQWID
jgi:XisH protein